MIYSKELYVVLGCLEVVIRNTFHEKLKNHFSKDDWMSNLGILRRQHKDQLDKAIDKLVKNKRGNYSISDLIAELSFGFWIHLLDSPYEQKFWAPALRHCFPHKFGSPVRQDVESRLKNLLKIRNKIAHLEPIIKFEEKLLQANNNALDIISWICPKTAEWIASISLFKEIWENNNDHL